jgi:hypothetical protein
MPFGLQPICSICSTNESQMWSKSVDGSIKCSKCSIESNDDLINHNKDLNINSIVENDNNSHNNNNNNNNNNDNNNKTNSNGL